MQGFPETARGSIKQDAAVQEQEYMNTAQSQVDSLYNDSVKYYVLENVKSWLCAQVRPKHFYLLLYDIMVSLWFSYS